MIRIGPAPYQVWHAVLWLAHLVARPFARFARWWRAYAEAQAAYEQGLIELQQQVNDAKQYVDRWVRESDRCGICAIRTRRSCVYCRD